MKPRSHSRLPIWTLLIIAAVFSTVMWNKREIPQVANAGVLPPKGAINPAASIAFIVGEGCGRAATGTGWVIDKNLIATSAHVVVGMEYVAIGFGINGQENPNYARVVGFDARTDLAILSVPTQEREILPLSSGPFATENYYSMGHPRSRPLEKSPLRGTTTRQHPIRGTVYEASGTVEPGDSGSPMLNSSGEVMGIVYATTDNYMSAYITPNSDIKNIMNQVRQDNFVTKTVGDCNTVIGG